jgi:hypothetical protein
MRVLLHIGTDKTGSTAIQHHLHANREWLAERGVHVPPTGFGPDNGHAALFEAGAPGPGSALAVELERAGAAGCSAAVLCWEGLHGWGRRALRGLAWLSAAYPVTVLVYLREQAEIIQSAFLQTVKQGDSLFPMAVFENRALNRLHPRYRSARYPRIRHYDRLLRRWETTLCPAAMQVRRYRAGGLLADFLDQLSLREDGQFRRLSGPFNPSLDVESALWLESQRRRGVAAADLRRLTDLALARPPGTGGGSRYFLERNTVELIRRHYRASNWRWRDRYLPGSGDAFPEPAPCWREVPIAELQAGAVRVGEALLGFDRVPTHEGPALRGRALAPLLQAGAGWGAMEDWGCWSDGDRSRLVLRLFHQHILPFHDALRLYLCGRYPGAGQRSGVVINGRDFGTQRLAHGGPGLLVPLELLAPGGVLEIELSHAVAGSSGRGLATKDGYGIESIGYDLVNGSE